MPGPTIDLAFVKQYEREVHEEYQRQGSMLRSTARHKMVKGADTTFQKMGSGTAVTKARHGEIPPMNLDHSTVNCSLTDYFARDLIDKFDELKINHDERGVVTRAGAWALGRKTDDLIITAANTTTTTEGGANALISFKRILTAIEKLQDNNVPVGDGMLYGIVTPHQWAEMVNSIDELKSKDYVSDNVTEAPYRPMRNWNSVNWIVHTGAPGRGTSTSTCLIWHHDSIGHAVGSEVVSDVQWDNSHWMHSVVNAMSQGSCLIDERACVKIPTNDTAALS
jgi:hypothetical protein